MCSSCAPETANGTVNGTVNGTTTNGTTPNGTTPNGTANGTRQSRQPYQSVADAYSNTANFKIIESTLREGEQFANAFYDTGMFLSLDLSGSFASVP